MIFSHMFFCDECGAANSGDALYCFACHQPINSATAQPVAVTQASAAQVLSPVVPYTSASMRTAVATSLLNNRYEIICEVGQGGFGVVYKARDMHSKSRLRQIAIKQINLGSLTARQIIEATDSYNREVTLLSHLGHSNLPRIYDHFTDPEHWYLVMDFIEGETLEEYLKQVEHLTVKETLDIGVQLANVLGYLHSQEPPIIFRDVKPANIMRSSNGHLYLIDFGIARHFNPAKKRDTGALGSPGYAAPEQYGRAQSTEQTDIYGLGATLTTLLLGDDDSNNSALKPKIPGNVQRLLDQMLEADASKRPKNMQVVIQRLQRLQISWKEVIGSRVKSLSWGLLIGSFPYSLLLLNALVARIPLVNGIFSRPVSVLAQLFFSLWPLIIIIQFISIIIFAFTPQRRLIASGIIAMIVLLLVSITSGWLPFGTLYQLFP
ncbi:MAG: protein kinase domain-containing protein [Ktedonobacteraceae bacterium]